MYRALRSNNLEAVQAMILEDPLATQAPLPEVKEFALLVAIRNACSPKVLQVLLKGGSPPECLDSALKEVAGVKKSSPSAEYPFQVRFKNVPCVLSQQHIMLPGSPAWFEATTMNEGLCCQYAVMLLNFGARLPPGPLGEDLLLAVESRGFPRLAYLLRHWSGESVAALMATCRHPGTVSAVADVGVTSSTDDTGATRLFVNSGAYRCCGGSSGGNNLVFLSSDVLNRIRDALAPRDY